ncbi:MAG: DUF4062 domain-containing protein [Proteobacteria bacterium]|nr:MAG: DUF4062 domain-containing protein [Pseudomonadota bacterium]
MAIPKIFVSSTCYDLQEIRLNLKNYITEFGCDSILSEFGDIFYDPVAHVQDTCVDAIKQSDLFILIIGNSYGSTYYASNNKDIPESITLQEFKKALSLKIPKMIFINKFVNYDYKNYRKFLEEKYTEYYSKNTVIDEQKELINSSIKKELDSKYYFSQKSYKYIFHFLDSIHELSLNNSYFEFENSDDIKFNIKKQFAGYFYNALKQTQEKMIDKAGFERRTLDKLEQFEKVLTSLADNLKDSNQQQHLDLSRFISSAEVSESADLREQFDNSTQEIFYYFVQADYYNEEDHYMKRVTFTENLRNENGFAKISIWVDSLKDFVNTYKWTQNISSEIVFNGFDCELNKSYSEIPLHALERLAALYDLEQDKNSFIKSIQSKFIPLIEEVTVLSKNSVFNSPTASLLPDDVPF